MKAKYFCTAIVLLAFFTACGQAPTATTSATLPNTPVPEPAPTLVGSWTTTVTKEDLLRVAPDFKQEFLCNNAGTLVWQFKADGTFSIDQTVLDGCPVPPSTHIESTWANEGNVVTFAKGTPDQEAYEWNIKQDLLTFNYRSGDCIPCKATNTANPWKRLAK